MFHDEGWTNGVQSEGSRHLGRINLLQALFRTLIVVVQEPCRIDNEPDFALAGREGGSPLKASLIQKVDRHRCGATEGDHMVEPLTFQKGLIESTPNTAAGPKDNRNAASLKGV
jgi:hypothetical protein